MWSRAKVRLQKLAASLCWPKSVTMRNTLPLVTFSFDDAPLSSATIGADILEEFGARGTYYVSGGLCGTASDGLEYLQESTVERLVARGHEVGCHTYGHVRAAAVSRREFEASLGDNREFFARVLPRYQVTSFSYPFGSVRPRAKLIAQSRFVSCRGIGPGLNAGRLDLGLLKAVPIYNSKVDRGAVRSWLRRARAQNGWLIFYTHDISEQPTAFGTTPDLFRFCVSEAAQQGCAILTVKNAIGALAFRKHG